MAQSQGKSKGKGGRSQAGSRGGAGGGSSRGKGASTGAVRGARGNGFATASRGSKGGETVGLGVPDPEFDLISIIYHALQGAETVEMYLEDADEGEAEVESDLREYFQDVADTNRRLAARGRALLAGMLGAGGGEEDDE